MSQNIKSITFLLLVFVCSCNLKIDKNNQSVAGEDLYNSYFTESEIDHLPRLKNHKMSENIPTFYPNIANFIQNNWSFNLKCSSSPNNRLFINMLSDIHLKTTGTSPVFRKKNSIWFEIFIDKLGKVNRINLKDSKIKEIELDNFEILKKGLMNTNWVPALIDENPVDSKLNYIIEIINC